MCPAFAVGMRLEADDRLTVEAPFGLDDLFAMVLRPNPTRPRAVGWASVTRSVLERWPEARVDATPSATPS